MLSDHHRVVLKNSDVLSYGNMKLVPRILTVSKEEINGVGWVESIHQLPVGGLWVIPECIGVGWVEGIHQRKG